MHNLKKATNRIAWRFTNGKSFKPNDEDIESINCLLNWINNQKKQSLNQNQLFAKLYIHFLTQFIRYHETTVFNNAVQQELSNLLNYPLDLFYQAFTKDLQENQWNKLLTDKTEKEKQETLKNYKQFKATFTKSVVESKLNEMITEALNRFS